MIRFQSLLGVASRGGCGLLLTHKLAKAAWINVSGTSTYRAPIGLRHVAALVLLR